MKIYCLKQNPVFLKNYIVHTGEHLTKIKITILKMSEIHLNMFIYSYFMYTIPYTL